jgi:hypothetical protein
MSESPRRVPNLLIPLIGVVLAGTWGLVGLRAMTTDDPVSVSGLGAVVAFTVAGIGLGACCMSVMTARARRRGRPVPAPESENLAAFFVMFGLVNIGQGLQPLFESSDVAAWGGLLICVAGGWFLRLHQPILMISTAIRSPTSGASCQSPCVWPVTSP